MLNGRLFSDEKARRPGKRGGDQAQSLLRRIPVDDAVEGNGWNRVGHDHLITVWRKKCVWWLDRLAPACLPDQRQRGDVNLVCLGGNGGAST